MSEVKGANYMQVVPMTDEQKLRMYMRQPKKKLAEMLVKCNNLLGQRRVLGNPQQTSHESTNRERKRAMLISILKAR